MKLLLLVNIIVTIIFMLSMLMNEDEKPDERDNGYYKINGTFALYMWGVMGLIKSTSIVLSIGVWILLAIGLMLWFCNLGYHNSKDKESREMTYALTVVFGITWAIYLLVQLYF